MSSLIEIDDLTIEDARSRKEDVLAQSPLFGVLAADDRTWICDRVEPVRFAGGTTIFERGTEPDALYVLICGGVSIAFHTTGGRAFSIALATVGAVFGEVGVLDGGTRSADAVAVTDVEALKLGRASLQEMLAINPRAVDAVIRFLCSRVRDTDRVLEAIALRSVEARLARFLLSAVKARTQGVAKGKVSITLGVSPSELSLLIGEGLSQVGTAMAHLEQGQAFRRDGPQIVCDVTMLARIADQGWD